MKLQIVTPIMDLDLLRSSHLASYRLRLAYVYEAAKTLGIDVIGGMTIQHADLYYVGKLTSSFEAIEVDKTLSELSGKRVIVDYTDDWLDKPRDATFDIYSRLKNISNTFITPVQELTEKLKQRGVNGLSIPDGIDEFEQIAPIAQKHNIPELMWFGHSSNVDSLIKILGSYLNQHKFNLHVVSNQHAFELLRKVQFRTIPKCTITAHLWSNETLIKVASNSDICIIPTNKIFASANRLVTALNLGLPVLADEIHSYSRLSSYFSTFSVSNIKKILSSPEEFHDTVRAGQKVVSEEFAKDKLIGLWIDLLKHYI